MDENDFVVTPKLIKLPKYLWDLINADSKRCRRSLTKHIEAILVVYLGAENVEINRAILERARELFADPTYKADPFLKRVIDEMQELREEGMLPSQQRHLPISASSVAMREEPEKKPRGRQSRVVNRDIAAVNEDYQKLKKK